MTAVTLLLCFIQRSDCVKQRKLAVSLVSSSVDRFPTRHCALYSQFTACTGRHGGVLWSQQRDSLVPFHPWIFPVFKACSWHHAGPRKVTHIPRSRQGGLKQCIAGWSWVVRDIDQWLVGGGLLALVMTSLNDSAVTQTSFFTHNNHPTWPPVTLTCYQLKFSIQFSNFQLKFRDISYIWEPTTVKQMRIDPNCPDGIVAY